MNAELLITHIVYITVYSRPVNTRCS